MLLHSEQKTPAEKIEALRAEVEQLESSLETIQHLFSEMIDIAKTHGGRVSLENSAYADLYTLLGMSEYRRRDGDGER
jgi:hypothetical protein